MFVVYTILEHMQEEKAKFESKWWSISTKYVLDDEHRKRIIDECDRRDKKIAEDREKLKLKYNIMENKWTALSESLPERRVDENIVGWLSAVDELIDLFNWFSREDLCKLKEFGYEVLLYEPRIVSVELTALAALVRKS